MLGGERVGSEISAPLSIVWSYTTTACTISDALHLFFSETSLAQLFCWRIFLQTIEHHLAPNLRVRRTEDGVGLFLGKYCAHSVNTSKFFLMRLNQLGHSLVRSRGIAHYKQMLVHAFNAPRKPGILRD